MMHESEQRHEETTTTRSDTRGLRVQRIISIALVGLVIISSIALLFKYSVSFYNRTATANATATAQSQREIVEETMAVPTNTAIAATQVAESEIVANKTAAAITDNNAEAVVEAASSPTPYPSSAAPDLEDSLTDSHESKGYQWDVNRDQFGSCSFTNGEYQVTASISGYFEYCQEHPIQYSNFTIEVRMTISQGDGGGLIFRSEHAGEGSGQFYQFLVNQNQTYAFRVFDWSSHKSITLSNGFSSFINPGPNTLNVLAIAASDNVFQIYVNRHPLAVAGDSSYRLGLIGLFAWYQQVPTTVLFQNEKIWLR